MKLDRNENHDGTGKYALLNLRTNQIQWGRPNEDDEFFVIKLKDRHSLPALIAYADSIRGVDPEFAGEVDQLAARSGCNNLFCKDPD